MVHFNSFCFSNCQLDLFLCFLCLSFLCFLWLFLSLLCDLDCECDLDLESLSGLFSVLSTPLLLFVDLFLECDNCFLLLVSLYFSLLLDLDLDREYDFDLDLE